LTESFIDRFGIVGPPEHCVSRLRQLADLGVDRFIVVGPSIDADRAQARVAVETFTAEVLPAIRELTHAA
jgi:5,10-methylenetetrahydromethanopterin reductase